MLFPLILMKRPSDWAVLQGWHTLWIESDSYSAVKTRMLEVDFGGISASGCAFTFQQRCWSNKRRTNPQIEESNVIGKVVRSTFYMNKREKNATAGRKFPAVCCICLAPTSFLCAKSISLGYKMLEHVM
ncbi:hypothetical protein C5167_006075 [Papaver somniferum]|uniref:Uncharacterized protein n=1 Tax=Papaver somniferum TaxID=3469 RepID=A0A4Y7JG48_PAPSO|nr:hypothetical protein C5167_006075 [Papaver somniferum]